MTTQNPKTIAILGGTGKEGKGLAYRWALAGHSVIIGSRTTEKAIAAVEEVQSLLLNDSSIKGMENSAAADEAEIVVLTVPFTFQLDMLKTKKPNVKGK